MNRNKVNVVDNLIDPMMIAWVCIWVIYSIWMIAIGSLIGFVTFTGVFALLIAVCWAGRVFMIDWYKSHGQ